MKPLMKNMSYKDIGYVKPNREGYKMERLLATIESTYGKSSGVEVNERFIIKDTREEREHLLDEWVWDKDYIQDNMEDFLSGKINSVYADLVDGDWDEPTGRHIFLQTKEEALEYEKDKYEGTVESIEQFFDGSLERSIRFD